MRRCPGIRIRGMGSRYGTRDPMTHGLGSKVTVMTQPRHSRYRRLSRVRPVSDPTERPPWNRLIPLVTADTLAIALVWMTRRLISQHDYPEHWW
jgi:hypothetical protein